ncbi:MAG: hypothetical protein FWD53_08750, partial [Phycisphaerales bacterium]|nr:hypothetical protein [Phycisphaerales bacterium]
MKRFAWIVLAFLAIFSTAACSTAGRGTAGAAAEQFDIPRLDNITIDGDASDWKDGGFRINMLTSRMGKVKAVNDLDARARLAYDQRGLLFLLTVRDEVACEHKTLWEGDSVELFIADLAASPDRYQYQVVIAPGMDSEFPEPRLAFMDQRSEELKKVALAPEYGRKPLLEDGKTVGYVLEMRLPWEQLGMTVGQDRGGGRKVGFQFVVNDLDAPRTPQFRLIWFPQERMHEQPGGMHTLRLSDRASPAIDAVANVTPERFRRTVVTVLGTEEAAGTTVAAEMGGVKVE